MRGSVFYRRPPLAAWAAGAAIGAAALLVPAAAAEPQYYLGVGGVLTGTGPDAVEQALAAQGWKVFAKNTRYIEASLVDPDTQAPVRARYMFDEVAATLKSVEFVQDDDKAMRQYIHWARRMTQTYGADVQREAGEGLVRDNYCHTRSVSVVLALFEQRSVLAYFHQAPVSGNCRRAAATRDFEPVAYGSRTRKVEAARSMPAIAGADPNIIGRKPPDWPSPLEYAAHRSQDYQQTLRCISIAAWQMSRATDANAKVRWHDMVQRLSSKLVGHGRREGMTPPQVDAEGREIVRRNHMAYQQGRKDLDGVPFAELDLNHCRAAGMISP